MTRIQIALLQVLIKTNPCLKLEQPWTQLSSALTKICPYMESTSHIADHTDPLFSLLDLHRPTENSQP